MTKEFKKTKFIAVEGYLGVGKSTLIEKIIDYYNKKEKSFFVANNPSENRIQAILNHLLYRGTPLTKAHFEKMNDTAALLFKFANVLQYNATKISRMIESGEYDFVIAENQFLDVLGHHNHDFLTWGTELLKLTYENYYNIIPDLSIVVLENAEIVRKKLNRNIYGKKFLKSVGGYKNSYINYHAAIKKIKDENIAPYPIEVYNLDDKHLSPESQFKNIIDEINKIDKKFI